MMGKLGLSPAALAARSFTANLRIATTPEGVAALARTALEETRSDPDLAQAYATALEKLATHANVGLFAKLLGQAGVTSPLSAKMAGQSALRGLMQQHCDRTDLVAQLNAAWGKMSSAEVHQLEEDVSLLASSPEVEQQKAQRSRRFEAEGRWTNCGQAAQSVVDEVAKLGTCRVDQEVRQEYFQGSGRADALRTALLAPVAKHTLVRVNVGGFHDFLLEKRPDGKACITQGYQGQYCAPWWNGATHEVLLGAKAPAQVAELTKLRDRFGLGQEIDLGDLTDKLCALISAPSVQSAAFKEAWESLPCAPFARDGIGMKKADDSGSVSLKVMAVDNAALGLKALGASSEAAFLGPLVTQRDMEEIAKLRSASATGSVSKPKSHGGEGASAATAIEQLGTSGSWNNIGGDIAPFVLASALDQPIRVVTAGGQDIMIDTGLDGRRLTGDLITVVQIGGHYYVHNEEERRLESMPPDGDCFFHAVSLQTGHLPRELRGIARRHAAEIEGLVGGISELIEHLDETTLQYSLGAQQEEMTVTAQAALFRDLTAAVKSRDKAAITWFLDAIAKSGVPTGKNQELITAARAALQQ